MAIRGGQIIHVGNDNLVIQRIQSAGPGDLNIPTETIYELGNYESVATIRDIPDITFNLESFDTSAAFEALLTGGDYTSGTVFDLTKARSLDITSPIKAGKDATDPFSIVTSVGLPGLMPDSVSYRFGLRDNARQTISLRGDSIYYAPGAIHVETFNAAASSPVTPSKPAGIYASPQGRTRVLAVTKGNTKLTEGPDFTVNVTSGGSDPFEAITIDLTAPLAGDETVRVMYFTNEPHRLDASVHVPATTLPAAIRGKDIDVYVGGKTPQHRWTGVQSVSIDWRATVEKDEEFGNYYATSTGFDVPTASGSVDILFRDPADMMARIRQITGVSATDQALGPNVSEPLPMYVVLKDGSKNGAPIKTIGISAARFTVPGYTGRANEKLTQTLSWEDDKGRVLIGKGGPDVLP